MIFFAFCAGFISGDDLKRFCVGSSKLICRASSYDNRIISFAIFFLNPSVDPVRFFLPNLYNPNTLSKKSIGTVRAESPQERYIHFTVYTFEGL